MGTLKNQLGVVDACHLVVSFQTCERSLKSQKDEA